MTLGGSAEVSQLASPENLYHLTVHLSLAQIKDIVMADFTFCSSTQRFARLHPHSPNRESTMVGSSWPVPVLGSLYGPGGLADGVFRSWVELHDGFFGAEHIAAFLSLTGMALVRKQQFMPFLYTNDSCRAS